MKFSEKAICLCVATCVGITFIYGADASEQLARASGKYVTSVAVKDAHKGPRSQTKYHSAVVRSAGDCCDTTVEFASTCDCDSVKSVRQKVGYTRVNMKSGKVVELHKNKAGKLVVDYDD